MQSALIISHSQNSSELIAKILKNLSFKKVTAVKTCGEARRKVLEQNFDLYIINSPVSNESGEELAAELIKSDISQVVFFAKNEVYDYMCAKLEGLGVITVSKPINKSVIYTSLKLSRAVFFRMQSLSLKTTKLTKKLEDVKLVSRAKFILISHLSMSEEQAHKHIEKQAMDMRKSRREIAQNILKMYEN